MHIDFGKKDENGIYEHQLILWLPDIHREDEGWFFYWAWKWIPKYSKGTYVGEMKYRLFSWKAWLCFEYRNFGNYGIEH